MTFKGYVRNGVVEFSEPTPLLDGTEVNIVVGEAPEAFRRTLLERLSSVVGKAEDLPADWSENHDLYLRGQYRQ